MPLALIQRPHQRPLSGPHQLAERHLGTRVRAQDSRIRGHTTRLTKVGDHRLLVRALLRATVQLADRDHGDVELLGHQLQAAREVRHFLLARLVFLARRHQLHVVDDDQLEARLLAEPARLRPDLHHREVRRVVDKQRGFADFTHPPREPRPVVVTHPARAHVGQLDLRFRRQQPHDDLGLAHFQREDDAGHLMLDRA